MKKIRRDSCAQLICDYQHQARRAKSVTRSYTIFKFDNERTTESFTRTCVLSKLKQEIHPLSLIAAGYGNLVQAEQ